MKLSHYPYCDGKETHIITVSNGTDTVKVYVPSNCVNDTKFALSESAEYLTGILYVVEISAIEGV